MKKLSILLLLIVFYSCKKESIKPILTQNFEFKAIICDSITTHITYGYDNHITTTEFKGAFNKVLQIPNGNHTLYLSITNDRDYKSFISITGGDNIVLFGKSEETTCNVNTLTIKEQFNVTNNH